jgi:hypothetical protein
MLAASTYRPENRRGGIAARIAYIITRHTQLLATKKKPEERNL